MAILCATHNYGVPTSHNPQQLWCIVCDMYTPNANKNLKEVNISSKENDTFGLNNHVINDHTNEFKRWGAY